VQAGRAQRVQDLEDLALAGQRVRSFDPVLTPSRTPSGVSPCDNAPGHGCRRHVRWVRVASRDSVMR
jgi:hypothetical protein